MRSRTTPDVHLAEVTRRRLELLSAEIAGQRLDLQPPGTDERVDDDTDGHTPHVTATPMAGRHARRSVGWRGLVWGWVHDRLPPTLQGRVQLGAAHLGVLALTIATGLAVTAWWVLRTDDAGALVPPASPVAATSSLVTPQPVAGTPSGVVERTPSGVVVVDVAGRVRHPGIATLPAGSRVIDALKAAGGVRRGVDKASINQARLLVDGEQIVVGEPSAGGAAASAAGAAPGGSSLVNLNTADQTTLESLPGVGPVTAQAIVTWREENGGFHAVYELLEVSGIGDAILTRLPVECQA
jgi:competence protein ComEA